MLCFFVVQADGVIPTGIYRCHDARWRTRCGTRAGTGKVGGWLLFHSGDIILVFLFAS